MKRAKLISTVAACVVTLTANLRNVAAESTPPSSIYRPAIAVEVWIIKTKSSAQRDPATELSGPSDEVAGRIQKLKAEGQVSAVDHFRLFAVENQKTTLQSGRTVPIPVGRTISAPGGRAQVSYQQQQVGTLTSVTAKVDDDAILVELQVEKSQLEQRTGTTEPDSDLVPMGTEMFTLHVTVRIENGKTVVAGGLEHSANEESAAQLVLISAQKLDESGAPQQPRPSKPEKKSGSDADTGR